MILIVMAYAMKRRWPLRSLAGVNILGSLMLGASLLSDRAYPGVALQAVWIVISILDLRGADRRANQSKD